MSDDYIRFLHISDSHFGVHYALNPRNLHRRAYGEIFFQKVTDVVQKAVFNHQVDFIIHSGDFFNRSKPPSEVVDRAVKAFLPALQKEVPIYILPGNHERSKLPLGLLPFSNENIHLFSRPLSFIFEKNDVKIKLTGFPYIRRNIKRNFHSLVRKAWFHQRKKTEFAILVIHQLIEGSCIENYTFRKGQNVIMFQQIPQKFNYIACGHVHRFQFLYNPRLGSIRSSNKLFSVKQNASNYTWQFEGRSNVTSPIFRGPLLSYAGSLERVSLMERNEPKGYIIGQFEIAKNGVQSIEYKFHKLPAVKMVYLNWDLYKATMTDYADKTLDTLYNIHSNNELQNQGKNAITAIFRIRIQGKWNYSKKDIEYVKEEARRCNIYLTFSYKA